MPPYADIKALNAKITKDRTPRVAVFVGATAGIAKAALTLLVSKNTPITVYIIGRGETKHVEYLDELRASNLEASIVWLEGQVSLLSDIQRLCKEITSREERIELLFLSAGYLPFGGRVETSEGLETANVLNYWGRALFTELLLPSMRDDQRSNTAYTPRVVSILAAGDEASDIPLDDLDLKKPENFGVLKIGGHQATLNTLYYSEVASRSENKSVAFIHQHPGVVSTGITRKNWGGKWWGPVVVGVMEPLLHLFVETSIEESAERSLYLITASEYAEVPETGGRFFRVSQKMESLGTYAGDPAQVKVEDAQTAVQRETERIIEPFL